MTTKIKGIWTKFDETLESIGKPENNWKRTKSSAACGTTISANEEKKTKRESVLFETTSNFVVNYIESMTFDHVVVINSVYSIVLFPIQFFLFFCFNFEHAMSKSLSLKNCVAAEENSTDIWILFSFITFKVNRTKATQKRLFGFQMKIRNVHSTCVRTFMVRHGLNIHHLFLVSIQTIFVISISISVRGKK